MDDLKNSIDWVNKKVFIKTKSDRTYGGVVLNQNFSGLIILDIKGHHVLINFDEIKILQEEL